MSMETGLARGGIQLPSPVVYKYMYTQYKENKGKYGKS